MFLHQKPASQIYFGRFRSDFRSAGTSVHCYRLQAVKLKIQITTRSYLYLWFQDSMCTGSARAH